MRKVVFYDSTYSILLVKMSYKPYFMFYTTHLHAHTWLILFNLAIRDLWYRCRVYSQYQFYYFILLSLLFIIFVVYSLTYVCFAPIRTDNDTVHYTTCILICIWHIGYVMCEKHNGWAISFRTVIWPIDMDYSQMMVIKQLGKFLNTSIVDV